MVQRARSITLLLAGTLALGGVPVPVVPLPVVPLPVVPVPPVPVPVTAPTVMVRAVAAVPVPVTASVTDSPVLSVLRATAAVPCRTAVELLI